MLALVGFALATVWWGLMALDRFGRPFREAGSRVQGHLLEVLLYGAFPRVMLRSLGALTRACARLSLSLLLPSLLFSLPLIMGFVLCAGRYAYRPASLGQSILVTLEGSPEWTLRSSPEFAVEATFRSPSKTLRAWRLKPLMAGALTLNFENGALTTSKSLSVGQGWVNPQRHPLGWSWLISPLEPPLPDGITNLSVRYAPQMISWNGHSAPWWLLLLLAFVAWSWLFTLLPTPGNWARRQQAARA